MNRAYLIVILFCCSLQLSAQLDFHPGYYLTNSNDTVFGLIDYRGDISNSKICVFRKDNNTPVTKLLPGTIKGYRFTDGKYYVSKQIPKDSGTIFMEYLINGKASIYCLRSNTDLDRYFIEKDGKMMEMNNDEVTGESQQYVRTTNQYKGVLKYYFQDAPSLIENINDLTFDKKSLIDIAKKYHEKVCNGEKCIVYERKAPKRVFHYGLYVGTSIDYLSVYMPIVTPYSQYTDISFSQKANLSLGFGALFQVNIPSINDKLFSQLILGYAECNTSNNNNSSSLQMKQSYFHMEYDLLYKLLPLKKIHPNFFIGYTINTFHSLQYQINYEGTSLYTTNFEIGNGMMGFTGGTGVEIPISSHALYFITIKYENDNFIAQDLHTQRICFLTGIMFP